MSEQEERPDGSMLIIGDEVVADTEAEAFGGKSKVGQKVPLHPDMTDYEDQAEPEEKEPSAEPEKKTPKSKLTQASRAAAYKIIKRKLGE